jgi:hypothetical protein
MTCFSAPFLVAALAMFVLTANAAPIQLPSSGEIDSDFSQNSQVRHHSHLFRQYTYLYPSAPTRTLWLDCSTRHLMCLTKFKRMRSRPYLVHSHHNLASNDNQVLNDLNTLQVSPIPNRNVVCVDPSIPRGFWPRHPDWRTPFLNRATRTGLTVATFQTTSAIRASPFEHLAT